MIVHYVLEPRDIGNFQKYWWRHKSGVKPVLVWIAAMVVIAASWYGLPHDTASLVTSAVLPGVIILTLAPYITTLTRVSQAKSTPGLLEPMSVRLAPDFMEQKTAIGESKVYWKNIHDIADEPHYIFLFLNKRMAYIIPKRAFLTEAQQTTFTEAAKMCWTNAKAGLPPPPLTESDTIWPPPPQA